MRVWLEGRVVDAAEARISVTDHGLTVGDGVFETLKVVAGEPFALTRHLTRLTRSAEALGLDAPDDRVLRRAIDDLLASGPTYPVGRLRITVTGGPGPMGSARGESGQTVLLVYAEAAPWAASTSVVTVPWTRNERSAVAGVKTTSYAENVVALAHARRHGASEALLLNTRGEVCEGTGSNVVLEVGGRLVTPPLASGCLAGVTRELVLEWTDVGESDVSVADLEAASEVALTSSTRDVHPVHEIDGRSLPAPGPMTAMVMAAFEARARETLDP